MAKKNRYTAQQVIDALTATRGLVYLAAQRLQCDPDTIMNYCKRYPMVEQAKHDARGALLDLAEAKLFLAVQRDEAWAITFCLKTIGRPRGYGERRDERSDVSELLKAVLLELAERSQARDVTPEAEWAPVPPAERPTNGVRPGLPAPPDVEDEAG